MKPPSPRALRKKRNQLLCRLEVLAQEFFVDTDEDWHGSFPPMWPGGKARVQVRVYWSPEEDRGFLLARGNDDFYLRLRLEGADAPQRRDETLALIRGTGVMNRADFNFLGFH